MSEFHVSSSRASSSRALRPHATAAAAHAFVLSLGLGGSALLATNAQAQATGQDRSALPAVTVSGKKDAAVTPYSGGQVSTGARMGLLGDKDFMETPFSVISYTEKFIEDRQAQSLTDVISATDPTVFSNGVSGAWSENYSIRGFASSTNDVMINGLAGMAPYYRTSPEMFERIEVLKGPSALLNGMPPGGSVAGAINLVPKRAGATPVTRLTTTYLSDSQWGGHIDVGRRFGEQQQFGVRANAVYRDGAGPVNNQDKKLAMGSLGLDWRGSGVRLSADLYTADDRIDGQTRGISLATGVAIPRAPSGETNINPSWAFVETKDKGVIVRGEYDINDRLTAYATAGRARTDYKYSGAISAQVTNAGGDYTTTMGQLAFEVEKKSAEVGLKGRFDTMGVKHQWTLNATRYEHDQHDYGRRTVPGANWTTNLYNPTWGPAPAWIAPGVSHTALALGSIGLADTMSFAEDRVQLTLGLRRQQVKSDTYSLATGALSARYDEGATSPAAAILFRATNNVSLYANYIEGLSQGSTAPTTAANAGEVFAPYKSRQKEAGVKVDLGEFAHTVSLFEIKRPSSYTDPVSNVFSFGGEQRNRGVEWGFFGAVMRGVRLMGGIAYVDPKLTQTAGGVNQGKTATGVPKLQGKLGGEWDIGALPGLTLTGNVTSLSRQYISADNSLFVAGRTTYDLGARYTSRFNGYPVTFRAAVANVTNKAYWGMPLLSSLALGAPRTVQISATVDL